MITPFIEMRIGVFAGSSESTPARVRVATLVGGSDMLNVVDIVWYWVPCP
jgi:hypothetical protein